MNNIITLYHGSTKEVQKPRYGLGSKDNDYGSGFYTTIFPNKADAWAVSMGEQNKGITNVYEIDTTDLNVVNLDQYGTLAWIATILSNRGVKDAYNQLKADILVEKYAIDLRDADIIIGYRADDSYMDIIEWFLEDKIDLSEVDKLFRKGNLGVQHFIQSPKAFEAIKFVKSYEVEFSEELLQDERVARREVNKFYENRCEALVRRKLQLTGITATNLIDYDFIYDTNTDSYYVEDKERF